MSLYSPSTCSAEHWNSASATALDLGVLITWIPVLRKPQRIASIAHTAASEAHTIPVDDAGDIRVVVDQYTLKAEVWV